jgi:hypothetical protein
MALSAEWIADYRVFYVRLVGAVAIDDLHIVTTAFTQRLQAMPEGQQLFLFLDNRQIEQFDVRLAQLHHLIKQAQRRDEALQAVIFLTHSESIIKSFLNMMANMAGQFSRVNFRLFTNETQALDWMAIMDSRLQGFQLPSPG